MLVLFMPACRRSCGARLLFDSETAVLSDDSATEQTHPLGTIHMDKIIPIGHFLAEGAGDKQDGGPSTRESVGLGG